MKHIAYSLVGLLYGFGLISGKIAGKIFYGLFKIILSLFGLK